MAGDGLAVLAVLAVLDVLDVLDVLIVLDDPAPEDPLDDRLAVVAVPEDPPPDAAVDGVAAAGDELPQPATASPAATTTPSNHRRPTWEPVRAVGLHIGRHIGRDVRRAVSIEET